MAILVFGRSGQVGSKLDLYEETVCIGRDVCDLKSGVRCYNKIIEMSPSAVINAAAYTAVDLAEDNELDAIKINSEAPYFMALACKRLDIPFIHISTDYVFDGAKNNPYLETDSTFPLNAYGRSKLLGESAVRDVGGRSVILRTSWVFSDSGKNFFNTIFGLAKIKNSLQVVCDQYGGPTHAADVAHACIKVVTELSEDLSKSGTYHYSGLPHVSWCGFAEYIISKMDRDVSIVGVSTLEYGSRTIRPHNSRLNCDSLANVFGIQASDLKSKVSDALKSQDF